MNSLAQGVQQLSTGILDTIFTRHSQHHATARRLARLVQELVPKIPARFLPRQHHFWSGRCADIKGVDGIDEDWDAVGCSLGIFATYICWTFLRIFTVAVSLHHVAEIVVQQLLATLPLVRRQWDRIDPLAPPGVSVGPFRSQRCPNFSCHLAGMGDVFEGKFTGVVKKTCPPSPEVRSIASRHTWIPVGLCIHVQKSPSSSYV